MHVLLSSLFYFLVFALSTSSREDENDMVKAEQDRAVGKTREHNISIHDNELANKRRTLAEQLVCSAI